MTIWTEFRRNTTEEDLRQICEREFEELISEITQKTITETVENLNRETTRQVLHLKNKMQKEINSLRLQLDYNLDEIEKQKLQLIVDVERARVETYSRQEERFRKIIAKMKEDNTYALYRRES